MLLPQSHYPDFSGITTLEELTLSMARKILEVQKNTTFNINSFDIIDINSNEETSTTTINVTGLKAKVNTSGELDEDEPFENVFDSGDGAYPFNKTGLLDAFFHVVLYQLGLEKNGETNLSGETNAFVDISITTVDTEYSIYPLSVDITLTDYHLTLIPQLDGGLLSKSKEYLL